MIVRGDCLACDHLSRCSTTSVDKALAGFTCAMFSPVQEPIYVARWTTMRQYGERNAVEAMMKRPREEEEEEFEEEVEPEEDEGE